MRIHTFLAVCIFVGLAGSTAAQTDTSEEIRSLNEKLDALGEYLDKNKKAKRKKA